MHFYMFYRPYSYGITNPCSLVLSRSMILWLDEPLKRREMSFKRSSNRPSTRMLIFFSSSSVHSHLQCFPSVSKSSYLNPVKHQMSLSGIIFFTFFTNGSNARWFSGSMGSPPRMVSPFIYDFDRSWSNFCSVLSVKSSPYSKFHV